MQDENQVNSISLNNNQTPKLNAALAKAQGKFIQPEKNKTVEVKKEGRVLYVTRYADLKNVIESFRQQLSENGLSFTQKTRFLDDSWSLVLTLRHESGEFDETEMPINLNQMPQQIGSALTYLKRYQAAAYFGIAADDDDDGNGAHGNQAEFDKNKNQKKPKENKAVSNFVKSMPKPEDIPQEFPPDDLPDMPIDEQDQDNPGLFVMPLGSCKGKRLEQLTEKTLLEILDWTDSQLKKVPPVNNISEVFEIQAQVTSFLKSVEVLK